MEIRYFDTAEQVGVAAATLLTAQVIEKPDSILGLATGSSPIWAYKIMGEMHKAGIVDFSKIITFNLDEYVNLPLDHPCSYHRFMDEELFTKINADPKNIHIPDGNAVDLNEECIRYDHAILKAGGIDVQLLGIGQNGHIGFNEPSDVFVYGCHVVGLTSSTIEANQRFFNSESEVPRQAISLGIGSIMDAQKIILIATGAEKAKAVYEAIRGNVNPDVQASILRTHPNAIFLLDKEAASLL